MKKRPSPVLEKGLDKGARDSEIEGWAEESKYICDLVAVSLVRFCIDLSVPMMYTRRAFSRLL
jgi:hypothetical protein